MNKGRIKIVCDLKPTGIIAKDKVIIPKIISSTLSLHEKNAADIKRLFEYYYNITDVMLKTKTQQPEINNRIGIDYANIAVNTINGYSFSNALTFSSRKVDDEVEMKAFNDSLDDDDYSHKLKKLTLNYGIGGLAYKYVMPATKDEMKEGIWYKTVTDIDPTTTYCVYDNSLEKQMTCAISYSDRTTYSDDLKRKSTKRVYTVWTKWHQWEFVQGGNNGTGFVNNTFEFNGETVDAYPLMYKKVPIVEYRSLDGTGYFELAIDLINAINALASFRVDAVQQSVDYIFTLRDIDIWSDGALEAVTSAIKKGILAFKSIQGATVQPAIDVLSTKLNQSEIQTLQDFLCQKLEEVLNIPNRSSKASGGDTGSAVESRNGFRNLENKASIVTDDIISGENEALRIIFAMCKNEIGCPFADMLPRDIEIKDNRNKYENLTNSANAYAVLRSAGMNDRTSLEVTRLVPDAITTAKINEIQEEKAAETQLQREERRTRMNAEASQQKDATNNGSNTQKSE